MTELVSHEFPVHQEEDEIPAARVLATAATTIVVFAVGVFFAGVIVAAGAGSLRPDVAGPGGTRPAPREISRVEQTPVMTTRDGLDLRDAQRRALDRWGWADRDGGIATIPIDRAIDVVVREEAR